MSDTAVQIKRPEPGPMAPPPAEIPAWTPPRMAAQIKPVAPKVWRPMPAEMDDLLSWLIPRLQDPWAELNVDQTIHWLRSAMTDPRALFVRTGMTCGLFNVVLSPLNPVPVVSEAFFRSRAPNNEEAILAYKFAVDWAASLSARKFFWNYDSDAAVLHVQPALNSLQKGYAVKKKSLFCVNIATR